MRRVANLASNSLGHAAEMLRVYLSHFVFKSWGFISGSVAKNPPAMQETQETQVQSLGQEDSLEEGMATHFSILAWSIPWTEEPGGLQSMGSQKVRHD